jgi:hypothetical protein
VSLQRDRADVENALGRKLTADEFRQLRKSDDWDELQSDTGDREMAVKECVYFVTHLERLERTAAPDAEGLRVQAASLALWERLRADPDVVEFRAGQHLGDNFVPLDDVDRWRQGASPDAVAQLDRLTRWLTGSYPIRANQAVGLILSDAVPIVSPIRTTIHWESGGPRVILDVDPDASADQVVAAFREARAGLVGDRRRPSPDNLELLSTWISLGRPTFAYLARTWNRSHPDRRIDRRTARTRVLRTLAWVGGVPYE